MPRLAACRATLALHLPPIQSPCPWRVMNEIISFTVWHTSSAHRGFQEVTAVLLLFSLLVGRVNSSFCTLNLGNKLTSRSSAHHRNCLFFLMCAFFLGKRFSRGRSVSNLNTMEWFFFCLKIHRVCHVSAASFAQCGSSGQSSYLVSFHFFLFK